MGKNIFEESTMEKLSGVFTNMTTPKRNIEPIQESVEAGTEEGTEETTVEEGTSETSESLTQVGSKFNEVFESILGEGCGSCEKKDCKTCEKSKVVKEEFDEGLEGEEGLESAEEEFVQVPRALLDELYAFLEDSMGSADNARVDDVEFELEEGADHTLAKNKMKNTQEYGSSVQRDKTGKSASKTGKCSADNSPRTGSVSFLKNLLSCYTSKGSPKQSHALKLKDQPINK